jgi:hypothetical protein
VGRVRGLGVRVKAGADRSLRLGVGGDVVFALDVVELGGEVVGGIRRGGRLDLWLADPVVGTRTTGSAVSSMSSSAVV